MIDKKCPKCGRWLQVSWGGSAKPPMCTCANTDENRLIRIEEKLDKLLNQKPKGD